jgi:hypothetical protein
MTEAEIISFFNNKAALVGEKYGFKLSNRPLPPKPNEANKKTG